MKSMSNDEKLLRQIESKLTELDVYIEQLLEDIDLDAHYNISLHLKQIQSDLSKIRKMIVKDSGKSFQFAHWIEELLQHE